MIKSIEKIDKRYELLDNKLNDMRVDIATIKEGQNTINIRLDETKEAINARIDDTNTRISDTKEALNKRLDNLDFIARSVVRGIFVALLVGFAKMLFQQPLLKNIVNSSGITNN